MHREEEAMNTGPIKPAAGIARTRFPESRPSSAPTGRRTELPPSQTVAAATLTRGTHDRPNREDPAQRSAAEILIDSESRDAIYRAMSVRPSPIESSDAALNLRVYRRADAQQEPDSQSLEKTI
jgi:hypothetical protein